MIWQHTLKDRPSEATIGAPNPFYGKDDGMCPDYNVNCLEAILRPMKVGVVLSVAYAYLSYYTAYLKANYPVEFYCACISCETDPESQSIYVNDAKRHNIEIIPPDLNESNLDFTILNGKILYGFKGIKGIGDKAIEQIIEHRPYDSAVHFFRTIADKKLRIPKQIIEALIKIGAFDSFGINRRVMLDTYDKFLVDYKGYLKKKSEDSLPLRFNDDSYFRGESSDLTLFDILSYEKKYMGIYISGNPFDFAKTVIGSHTFTYKQALEAVESSVFCEVMSIKEVKTKAKAEKMGIYKCIDSDNNIFEFPLFPENYKKYNESIEDGSFLIVNFKCSPRGLVCLSIKNINAAINEYTKTQKSENSITSISIRVKSLADLRKFIGRQNKSTEEDASLIRPCYLFYTLGSYTFGLGSTQYSSSNSSIRLLNQMEGVDIKLNR